MGSIIILLAIVFSIWIEVYTWKAGVVPMPTIPRVRRAMAGLLPDVIEGEILELGCGWGGLLVDLAKKYPQNTIVGYEISPLPYCVSRMKIWAGRHKNVQLRRRNFMADSFAKTGAVLCYLTRKHMVLLEPKFKKELPQNATVVSSTFPMPAHPLQEKFVSKGLWNVVVFKYQF